MAVFSSNASQVKQATSMMSHSLNSTSSVSQTYTKSNRTNITGNTMAHRLNKDAFSKVTTVLDCLAADIKNITQINVQFKELDEKLKVEINLLNK